MEFEPSWAYVYVSLYVAPACVVLVFIGTAIVGIWSRTAAKRMCRRIQNDLGRAPDKGDLISIRTWMKVDEVEEKKHPGSAWAPRPDPSLRQGCAWAPSP